MCWVMQQLDALNELTSLFPIGSDAGNSLMIDIRSSAKIRNYASLQPLYKIRTSTDASCQICSLRSSYDLFELGIALINLLCCTPLS